MYCLNRGSSGNYYWTAVSIDDPFRREVPTDEVPRILRERGCPEEMITQIMSETHPGAVML